jgi:hypothetical protein
VSLNAAGTLYSLNRRFGHKDASNPLILANASPARNAVEVLVMRPMKKDLSQVYTLSAVSIAFALVLSGPLIAPGPVLAQAQERAPQHSEENQAQVQQQAATFAGTVVKDGEHYDLRDSSGETFKLDDAERARPFAGKTVKVTGELDSQANVIHVESIEGIEG